MRVAPSLVLVAHLGCSPAPSGTVAPGPNSTGAPLPSNAAAALGATANPTVSPSVAASLSAPKPSAVGSVPAPVPEPVSTSGAAFALRPGPAQVKAGASIALSLVNEGKAAHSFEVGEASNSCGGFSWQMVLIDDAGQRYEPNWSNPMVPCGAVFTPAHAKRFPPGDVTVLTIDTQRPYNLAAAPTGGISGRGMQEPPNKTLAPGRYVVEVRGGDVVARTALTITP